MPRRPAYSDLRGHALAHGLTRAMADRYAALATWLVELGLPRPPRIVSGRRSRAWTREAQRAWDQGRGHVYGLVQRPVSDSRHLTGEAFDLEGSRARYHRVAGRLWERAGFGRWGGRFNDPNHYDAG